jgi:alkylation response protein AidB-like acyl-CoA dehydrogenase
MNFELTEEHLAVKEAARDFAQNILKPGVIERDNQQKFPVEEMKQLGELGFLGMMVDPKYGGSGMDTLSYVLAMEEISKIDASASVCMSVNNSLVCWGLKNKNKNTSFRLQKVKKLARFACPNLKLVLMQLHSAPLQLTWATTTF